MNKFSGMNTKEKAEYIAMCVLYPFMLLFSWLGKSVKLFSTKKRQITASVLSFVMIMTAVPTAALADLMPNSDEPVVPSDYWTDAGNYDTSWYDNNKNATEYTISTAQELAGLSVIVNGLNAGIEFKFTGKTINLVSSIDLSAHKWTAIGNLTFSFEGTFDGKNNTISKMIIVEPSKGYQGLFGISKGTIKNLGVVDSSVTGKARVAGVVAYNYGTSSKVENCYNTGTVSGTNSVGGVVECSDGTVANCYNTGEITGTGDNIGGVIGVNTDTSKVENCYNTGTVNGASYTGGVVGYNSDNGTVTSCYNTGAVNGKNNVGGVVGYNTGTSSKVENCYNTGAVNGTDKNIGGVVGYNDAGTLTSCNNTGTVTGTGNAGGVVGINTGTSKVENCYNTGEVKGASTVGGVVGYNKSTVTSCYNTGVVTGTGDSVGGVVGYNNGTSSKVENCYNTGTVNGAKHTGGVVGYNSDNDAVTSCYNTGVVTSTGDNVGGVVGYNFNCIVSNCYNTGTVTGTGNAGGVVGYSSGYANNNDNNTVTSCYNTGVVTSTGDNVGGVVGYNFSTVTNTYFLEGTAEKGIGAGYGTATAKTEAKMKTLASSLGEAFCNAPTEFAKDGVFSDTNKVNKGYPVLKAFGYTDTIFEGAGTQESPYLIKNAYQLDMVKNYLGDANNGLFFKLANDIDLSPAQYNRTQTDGAWTQADSWTPIGNTLTIPFTATFDGNGYVVKGMFIDNSTLDYQGLFGNNKGIIKNLGVVDSSVTGKKYVGGVAGYNWNTLTNCYNTGTVNGGGDYIGGVSGGNTDALTSCYNTGAVNGANLIGGVVGYNNGASSKVENCYNTGAVNGKNYVGGVVGDSEGTVASCYNTGVVTGTGEYVGGVVGRNRGTLTSCYNTGTITGTGECVGGVAGYNSSGTSINNFYSGCAKGISNLNDSAGQCTPFVTASTVKSIEAGESTDKLFNTQDDTAFAPLKTAYGDNFAVSYSYSPDKFANTDKGTNKTATATITVKQPKLDMVNGGWSTTETVDITTSLTRNDVTVTVPTPSIANITAPTAVAIGNALTLTAPTVTDNGFTISSKGWQIKKSTDSDFSSFTTSTKLDMSYNGAKLRYFASYSDGTVYSNEVAVTVNKATPSLSLKASPTSSTTYGNDITLTATLANRYNSNSNVSVDFYVNNKKVGTAETNSSSVATYIVKNSNAGNYTFDARVASDSNNMEANATDIKYTISKASQADLTMRGNTDHTFGYVYPLLTIGGSGNGSLTFKIIGGTGEGTIQGASLIITKAGTFILTATKAGDDNYNEATSPAFTITVNKAKSTISVKDKTTTYDKTAVTADTATVTGSTGAVTYKYYSDSGCKNEISAPTEAGTYYVQATVAEDDNYKSATSYPAKITINRRTVTITGVTVNNKVYDGTTDAVILSKGTLNNVISGDNVEIKNGTCTFAGANAGNDIPVSATGFGLYGNDAANYMLPEQPIVSNANITKAPLNIGVSKVTIKTGAQIPALRTTATGFVNGESASTILGFKLPTATVNGSYDTTNQALKEINVKYSGGNATNNYEFKYTNTAEIEIQGVDVQDGDYKVSADNTKWQKSDLTITPSGDYKYISTNKANWSDSITLSTEGENSSVTFYLKSADGVITASKTINYKLDKTAPSDIKVQYNTNEWKSLLNSITFGVFFKENVTVTAKATDSLSKIANIKYFASDEEISNFDNVEWKDNLTLTQNSKKIVYVKATDNAGNYTVNHEGVVLYSNSTIETKYFEYNYDIPNKIDIKVNANGNTLKHIIGNESNYIEGLCDTINGDVYSFSAETIEYLFHTFSEDTLTFKFVFNPMGVDTDEVSITDTVTIKKHVHTPLADDGDCTTAIKCKDCGFELESGKQHNFGGAYVADGAKGHYQNCQNANCTKHNTTVAHTGKDDDNCLTEVKCTVCQFVITQAKAHEFSDVWEKDNNNHWHNCKNCNEISQKVAHIWDNGKVTTEPTYETEGVKTFSCLCGMTKTQTVDKLIDSTNPTGEIKISDNSFKSFVNEVTFNLFFKESQDVSITGTDFESGINKIYYYKSQSKMTYDEVIGMSDEKWTDGSSFTLSPDWKGVVYAKIVDKSGNLCVISSDGMVLDATAPVIEGVTDGGKYCNTASVTVTVSEDNIESVKLGNETVKLDKDGKFTVNAKDEQQTITVTDKAGNVTTATITVYANHVWDNGKVTTEPTTTKEGVKTYTCTICGETKTEPVAKLTPVIIGGGNTTFTQGGKDGLTFKFDGSVSNPSSVLVDGKEIDKSNYTVSSDGSTITINREYLNTVSVGKHTLEIKLATGTVASEFNVNAKETVADKPNNSTSPDTGDAGVIVWIALLFVSGGSMTTLLINKKRKKINSK